MRYEDFYSRSMDEPEAFWAEQARLIEKMQEYIRGESY